MTAIGWSSPPPRDMGEMPSREFHDYGIYGISLRSQIPLRFSEQPIGSAPDVTLLLAPAPWFADVRSNATLHQGTGVPYEVRSCPDGSDYLRWPDLFEFVVSPDGHLIACGFTDPSLIESFQAYLLGQIVSFALIKQHHEPIHATAIVVDHKAVAFLGHCGAGKSTLAAAFLHQGFQLLSDDLLLIRDVNGTLSGYAGAPRIKLFPAIARHLLSETARGPAMHPNSEKLVIQLEPDRVAAGPVPIHSFYVLDRSEQAQPGIQVDSLSGSESLLALLRSTFNVHLLNPDRLRRQFLTAEEWRARIPVRRLTYRSTLATLEHVRRAIVSDVRSVGEAA